MSSPTHFTPIDLNTTDADAWDDTALVAAFENAVASHRLEGDPAPAKKPRSKRPLSAPSEPNPKRQAPTAYTPAKPVVEPVPASAAPAAPAIESSIGNGTGDSAGEMAGALQIPPPPVAFLSRGAVSEDTDLTALLAAWYEAGYRAGVYASRRGGRAH